MSDRLLGLTYPARTARLLRSLVGAAALARTITLVPQLRDAADPATAAPLAWGGLVSGGTWPVIVVLWVAASVALIVGSGTRVAAATLAILAFLLLGTDVRLRWNHLYVLGLVALVLAVAGRTLDGRPRAAASDVVPGWPLFVLRCQVTIIYVFAGVAKLNEDFLSGFVLHERFSAGMLTGWLPPQVLGSQPLLVGIAVAVIAAELWLAFALWVRRWFGFNVVVAVALHAPMVVLAGPLQQLFQLSLFTVLMWTLLLAFRHPLVGCLGESHASANRPTVTLVSTPAKVGANSCQ